MLKPSSWVGCYDLTPLFRREKREPTMEVRQDGSTLYSSMGRDGPYEERLIWASASPKQLRLMKESVGGAERDGIEVTSGLVMAGTASGIGVKSLREEEIVMGFWWIRGFEIEGDPTGKLPRTKETLRTSKEMLYFIGPGAFDNASKVPCAVKK